MLNKKIMIFLTFIILLLTFSGVSAADSNDMSVNSDENLLSADDTTAVSDKSDVELITTEQYKNI